MTSMRFRPSIRTALLGLVGIPLFALILALAYDTYRRSQANIAEAYRIAAEANAITAAETEQFLIHTEYVLSELSRRPQVQALEPASCDPLLADWKRLQPAYANVLTMDATGRLMCSATGTSQGQAAAREPVFYFSETVRTRGFTVGKPVKGFITGRWVSGLAYPIQNGEGQVTGVVAASVDLANFQSQVAARNLPPTAVVGIINGEGTVIARSVEAAQRVGRVSNAEAAKIMLAQRQGAIRARDYKGMDRFYAFTPIAHSDWIAFVSLDAVTVLRPAQRTALERLASAIAIILTITGLTFLVSRRISKPIEGISKSIAATREGDLHSRSPAGGPMEIHQIAVELNSMLDARMHSEAALRESEQRFKLAASTGNVWDWNILTNEASFPREFWLGLGYDEQDIKKSVSMLESVLHPEDNAHWHQAIKDHISRRVPYDFDYRARTKSGEYRWFNTKGQARWDENGRATYMAGTTFDITERKLAEQRIREQLDELTRWQELMIGREERMLLLKAEVNELLARQGQPIRYPGEADS